MMIHWSAIKSQDHDQYAVAIIFDNLVEKRVVGHVAAMLREMFSVFLSLSSTTIRGNVVGPQVNRGGGYGLEIPMDFVLYGDHRAIKNQVHGY